MDELGDVDVEVVGADAVDVEAVVGVETVGVETALVLNLTSSMNIELVDDQPLQYIIPTEALEILLSLVFMLVFLRSVSSTPLI